MSGHLGTEIPALVDGELDHAARERALGHLARCAACRAEVDDERRLKARLRDVGAAGPLPGHDLAQRLLRLAPPGDAPTPSWPAAGSSGLLPPVPRLPPPTPASAPALRRGALGGAVLVVGLGAVLALGGPSRPPGRPPVDPTSDAFVVDFASTGSRLQPGAPPAVAQQPGAQQPGLPQPVLLQPLQPAPLRTSTVGAR